MIDANKGASEETLRRFKEASYERFRIELIASIERLLDDFEMTWDDLAEKLQWKQHDGTIYTACFGPLLGGAGVKKYIGGESVTPFDLDIKELNEIAHVFSAEPYIIFRPRFPYINT
jgi:hypothetical protein